MAADEKKSKPQEKAPKEKETAPKDPKETAPKEKASSEPKEKTPAEAKPEASAKPDAAGEAPKNYSRGEGQKTVTQAYKDNWNAIYGKKKKKR